MIEEGEPTMNIHESAEDYLETILMLYEKNGQVRSIDIATELNFSKPSVSIAMKKLRENGYIEMDANSLISLTDAGYAIASRVYERHRILTRFFLSLGVSEGTARTDACQIEHHLSDETWTKLKEYVNTHME